VWWLTIGFFPNSNRDGEGQDKPRLLKQIRKIALPSTKLNYGSLHSPLHHICDGKLWGADCGFHSSPVSVKGQYFPPSARRKLCMMKVYKN